MESVTGVVLLLLANVFGDVQSQDIGSLRLKYVFFTSYSYERLEMYYSNEWVPFTINGFDMQVADLACKTLGYSFASSYASINNLRYDQAFTNFSIYNVHCPRSATSFNSCSYNTTRVYTHSDDVSLQCTYTESSLRLVSSSGYTGSSSGRLQIYINNTWGTVCDDDFGATEAGIACRQLEFYYGYKSYDSASDLYSYSSYISGPIWLDNLNYCSYDSTDLRSCTRAVGVHDCTHKKDVVLTCYASPSSYSSSSLSSGAAAGAAVGFLLLLSGMFTGVILCLVAIVVHLKKRPSRGRTVNIAQNTPEDNYQLSDIPEQNNTAVSEPATGYMPYPCNPVVPQQNTYPQKQCTTENLAAREDRPCDEDGDKKKLLVN